MNADQIIAALGGTTAVATLTGAKPNTVTYWRHRNSIPPNHWMAIAAADEAKKAGVTVEALAATRAKRRAPEHV